MAAPTAVIGADLLAAAAQRAPVGAELEVELRLGALVPHARGASFRPGVGDVGGELALQRIERHLRRHEGVVAERVSHTEQVCHAAGLRHEAGAWIQKRKLFTRDLPIAGPSSHSRLAVRVALSAELPASSPPSPSQGQMRRIKDRTSYDLRGCPWRVDVTRVATLGGGHSHEVELELDGTLGRALLARDDVLKAGLDLCARLAAAAHNAE